MKLTYSGLPTDVVRDLKSRSRDAYDLPIERHVSNGSAYPCRHCLGAVPKGASYLILAHRPFDGLNAYTETGPIFLCAEDCKPYAANATPKTLDSPTYITRGYTVDERILYGTGQVTDSKCVMGRAAEVLENPKVAFVDVRSAKNNCWQGRITRAED